MKQSIPTPVAVAIIAVVVIVGLGIAWFKGAGNGESRNPNVGHPDKSVIGPMSKAQADALGEETYMKMLKQNRPDLSDAEIKTKADHWWKVKNGQAAPN